MAIARTGNIIRNPIDRACPGRDERAFDIE
jgi:hypothetical protein